MEQMTNEERKNYYMNRNIKLSPIIIALTWDVVFVWAISTMYFTNVKGLTYSQTILLDSVLMFFGFALCIPLQKIFQKMSPNKAIRFSLVGYSGYLLLCMLGNSYPVFICAQFFLAFGYVINAIKSNLVLTDSLKVVKRDKDYQRVYGKGMSLYYTVECIGAVLTTYIYEFNPQLCFVCSLVVVSFAMIVSLLLAEPSKFQEKNIEIDQNLKQPKQQPDSLKKIVASTFLISALVYAFFLRGTLSITGSALKIYLNQLIDNGTIPLTLFGYLYAISRVANILTSKYQFKLDLKFGVRSLILINIAIIIGFVGVGLLYIVNSTAIASVIAILIFLYLVCCLRMPNQIFMSNYLMTCTKPRNIERVYALKTMVEYLGFTVFSAFFAFLLEQFGDHLGYTFLMYIGIVGLPLILSVVIFIRSLCKKFAQKYTIIKDEYVND